MSRMPTQKRRAEDVSTRVGIWVLFIAGQLTEPWR
jgi:hypothetical protein